MDERYVTSNLGKFLIHSYSPPIIVDSERYKEYIAAQDYLIKLITKHLGYFNLSDDQLETFWYYNDDLAELVVKIVTLDDEINQTELTKLIGETFE